MDTIAINETAVAKEEKAHVESDFWTNLEFNRYGYGSALVLAVVCLSGLTAGFGGLDFLTRVIVGITGTMAVVISFMAVMPMKWIVRMCVLAIVVDLFFIIAGFLG